MKLHELRHQLLPAREQDPKFDAYVRGLSHSGLQTVGAVEIAAPLLMLIGRAAITGGAINASMLWQGAAMISVGLTTLLIARTGWHLRHPSVWAWVSAWLAPSALICVAIMLSRAVPEVDDFIPIAAALIILTAVTSVPLLPWHALVLGLSVEGMYILSCWATGEWEFSTVPFHSDTNHIFLIMLALLATFIAAYNYEHRVAEYHSHQEALRAAEALTGAQLRAQLAESAISIGKMAAALSHEINSPLGTLRSALETLIAIADRQVEAPPEKRENLRRTREELRRAIEESATRIDEVSGRLRRFVSLAEADLKPADLNELLSDVGLLHADELRDGGIRLELDLEKSIPPLTCRPQLLSSVFSTLLSNAIHAVNGNGRIQIATRGGGSEVEVMVRDNGRGMSPEDAETIFDPTFKVESGRVASGNWSLFNSRQIVYEHGGDIRIETALGQGTIVHVILPLVASGRGSTVEGPMLQV